MFVDKFKSLLKKIGIAYLIYVLLFGVLIFKLPVVVGSDLDYDTDLMLTSSDDNSYAYVVEDIDEAMNIRLSLIEKATNTIDLSYYKYLPDESGEKFTGALLKRADEGIKIRIVIDGNSYSKGRMFKTLNSHKNVEYYIFEPNSLITLTKFHNVLHDKLLLIDENYGLVGGRNISDRFLDGENRVVTLDRDVLVYSENKKSDVGIQMKEYFDELTTSKYTVLKKNKFREKYNTYKELTIDKYKKHRENGYDLDLALREAVKIERATFVRSPINRFTKEPVLFNVVQDLMKERNDIVIQSPYITKSYLMKMHFPLNNDKNITFITNNMGTNPNLPGLSGYVRLRKNLATNYNVFEVQKENSIHAKSITIGDDISIIGSQNMDHRSMFLSTESSIVIYSKDFQIKLNEKLNHLKDNALKVDSDGNYIKNENTSKAKNNIFKRIVVRIFSWITTFFNEMLIKTIKY